jgi:DNA-binding XRE family transcriptional regulator
MQDKVDRKRHSCGEKNGTAKLTFEKAANIRGRYKLGGITQPELALMYGVSTTTIANVIYGKLWK